MDFLPSRVCLVLALVLVFDRAMNTVSADKDLTDDFVTPAGSNRTAIDGGYFAYSGFRGFRAPSSAFAWRKATVKEFPALDSQGVSVMLLEFQPQTINPPHSHPRSTELLYLVDGDLYVAFVDTTGKLFQKRILRGDLFVFPKGLVHYQFNNDTKKVAKAASSFGSSNPGTVAIPLTLFGTQIPTDILARSFNVDDQTIAHLRSPYERVVTN